VYLDISNKLQNDECDFCLKKKHATIYLGAVRYLGLCKECFELVNKMDRFKLTSKRALDTFLNNKKDDIRKLRTNPEFVKIEKIRRHERHLRDQRKKDNERFKQREFGESYTKDEWEKIDQAVSQVGIKTDSEVYSR